MRDEDAVSSTLGAVFLVAITVTTLTLVGLQLLDEDPPEATHVQLDGRLTAGADGWGSGDERLTLTHRGGHALDLSRMVLRLTVDGNTTEPDLTAGTGTGLGDGSWDPGDTFVLAGTFEDAPTSIQVIWTGPDARILLEQTVH